MNRLALCSNVLGGLPRRAAFAMMQRLGFRYVDIWAAPVIAQHVDPAIDDPQDVLAELLEYGLTPISLSLYYTTDAEKRARMRFAAAIGAPYVVFELAPNADYVEKMSNISLDGRLLTQPGAGFEVFREVLWSLLEEASRLGIRIAIQVPHVYTVVENAGEFEALLPRLEHPALAFLLSPTHALARGSTIAQFQRLCGGRLAILNAWNVKPGYIAAVDDRRWGTPAEQLSLRGYFDFVPWLRERSGPFVALKCHGTEKWKDETVLENLISGALAAPEKPN